MVEDYNSIDKLERLGGGLVKKGWTSAQVEKLLGRNLLRLYRGSVGRMTRPTITQ